LIGGNRSNAKPRHLPVDESRRWRSSVLRSYNGALPHQDMDKELTKELDQIFLPLPEIQPRNKQVVS
jgi:hypothetical protein